VFIFLQATGWIVVPNSRKADTMSYEFVAINERTKERAIVQVKSGGTELDSEGWDQFRERVFLFQAHGNYLGAPPRNVTLISPRTIERFMNSHIEIMPRTVRRWIEFAARVRPGNGGR